MESSNRPNNSQFNELQIGECKADLPATIKQECELILELPSNSDHHSSEKGDMLSSVKTERGYGNDDKSHLYNAREDVQRWTVTSSAVIPLVKREPSFDPDHDISDSTQPEGAMKDPKWGRASLSSSSIGADETRPQCASKSSLLNSQYNEKYHLNSQAPMFVDTDDSRNGYESISFATKDKGRPPGGFTDSSHLNRQGRKHTGEKPYTKKCRDGDESISNTNPEKGLLRGKRNTSKQIWFTSKGHLSEHQLVRTGEKLNKCTVCEKEFTEGKILNQHLLIHTGEKSYKCSVCTKEFTWSGGLTRHQRIHTGKKPYKCSVCSKTFSDSGNLTRHLRVHTGEKPYTCSVCGKTCNVSSNLTTHMHVHTREGHYRCSVCGKEFSAPSNLARHMHVHTGERH